MCAVWLYQWIVNLDGGFNWYVGAGGGFASYSLDDVAPGVDDSDTSLFIAGDIGIEYNFDIPIQLSLDFRPEMYFGGDYADFRDGFGPDIALGIRYRF